VESWALRDRFWQRSNDTPEGLILIGGCLLFDGSFASYRLRYQWACGRIASRRGSIHRWVSIARCGLVGSWALWAFDDKYGQSTKFISVIMWLPEGSEGSGVQKFGFDFGLRCFCGVWSRFCPARHCLTGTRVDFDMGFSQTPGKCPITLIHSPYRVAVFIPRLAVRIPRPMRKDKNTL